MFMHRRQSQRGASSWERKRDPVLIALSVVCGDRPAQLLRVERFGLRHLGDCHQHHQNFFISHGHNLPFTCRKTACFVSFSRFTAVGSLSQTPVVFSRVTPLTAHRARSVTGFPKDAGGPFAARAHATRKAFEGKALVNFSSGLKRAISMSALSWPLDPLGLPRTHVKTSPSSVQTSPGCIHIQLRL